MDRDRAIQLAQKLAAFNRETATQAEVELAATRLQKIMNEHNLSSLDLKPATADANVGQESKRHAWKRPPFWLRNFIQGIGVCFRVKPIWYFTEAKIVFVGDKTDIALATYFAGAVLELNFAKLMTVDWHTQYERGGSTAGACKGFRPAWIDGFMQAILKRLRDEYDSWYAALDASKQSQARGLIVIKTDAIKKYVDERFGKLVTNHFKAPTIRDHAAHVAGYERGMAHALNKGVRHEPSTNPNIA